MASLPAGGADGEGRDTAMGEGPRSYVPRQRHVLHQLHREDLAGPRGG